MTDVTSTSDPEMTQGEYNQFKYVSVDEALYPSMIDVIREDMERQTKDATMGQILYGEGLD